MYCKQCGTQMEQQAKFCPSCGTPVEQQPQRAPEQFQQDYVDREHYQYQKSGFKGKQMSTGTSGSISFGGGGPKKRGFFGKLIKLAVIIGVVAIIAVVVSSFFGGPITYVESGTGIDLSISELTGKTDTFATTDAEIYILFDYEDLEVGTQLFVNLFYEDDEMSMDSYYFDIAETVGWGYVGFPRPTSNWAVGEYTVEFVLDDEELLETYTFTVE